MERNASLARSMSRRGARVLVLAVDNGASRMALRMAAALLRPADELQVVTVVSSEESRAFGDALLTPFCAAPLPGPSGALPAPVVVVKRDDQRLGDAVAAYVAESRAELVVCGSHHLCVKGTRDEPLPASGSFALRLAKVVRCCPLLVVKANSTGHYLASGSTGTGLRVMVDCQSNTRHLLSWLMGRLDPAKDALFLAVTRAVDQGTGRVKETARRMMTNFSVQAAVSEFYVSQRLLKEAGGEALPQAARMDSIDVIALQAPPCRSLPPAILEVLHTAAAAVLLYHGEGSEGGTSGGGGDTDTGAAAELGDDVALAQG